MEPLTPRCRHLKTLYPAWAILMPVVPTPLRALSPLDDSGQDKKIITQAIEMIRASETWSSRPERQPAVQHAANRAGQMSWRPPGASRGNGLQFG